MLLGIDLYDSGDELVADLQLSDGGELRLAPDDRRLTVRDPDGAVLTTLTLPRGMDAASVRREPSAGGVRLHFGRPSGDLSRGPALVGSFR